MELGNIRYGAQIAAAATSHHLDPQLLAAVAAQETGGPGADSGNNVVGDGGHGHGVFQIDDRSWSFANTPGAMDPARNADFAAGILEDNLRRYGGDVRAALSAYNTGSPTATGTPTTWADGSTLGYADSVLRHYADLSGDAPQAGVASGTASSAFASLFDPSSQLGQSSPLDPSSPFSATSQLTPPGTWRSLDSASQQPESLADRALGDLIDGTGDGDGDDA